MNIELINNRYFFDIKQLSPFFRLKQSSINSNIFNICRINKKSFKSVNTNYTSTVNFNYKSYEFGLNYQISSIYKLSDETYIENIVNVDSINDNLSPYYYKELNVLVLNSYLFVKENDILKINSILTISSDNGDEINYLFSLTKQKLEKIFNSIFERAYPFITISISKNKSLYTQIKDLKFPYKKCRDGQKEFINEEYIAIQKKTNLLVNAPTGIGKSISSLYPAIKSLGEKYINKIFYLTNKGTNFNIIKDTLNLIQNQVSSLTWIYITAKEKNCLYKERKYSYINCSKYCDFISTYNDTPYELRRDLALTELLNTFSSYDQDKIKETAIRYHVCPYELSLDVSEYCDIIVCDYNYVFDKGVRFRRYFNTNNQEKYLFLIDESHNLPERIRSIYSESISSLEIDSIYNLLKENLIVDHEFYNTLNKLKSYFEEVISNCDIREINQENKITKYGYTKENKIDIKITSCINKLKEICDKYIKKYPDFAITHLDNIRSKVIKIQNIIEEFDDKFVLFNEVIDNCVTVHFYCIDTSSLISESLNLAKSTILYSATLLPMDYYKQLTGQTKTKSIEISSPFPMENLDVYSINYLSSRLKDRKESIGEIIRIIGITTKAKVGNYLIFFPSYEYLNLFSKYIEKYKNQLNIQTFTQTPNMSFKDRNDFINQFSKTNDTYTKLGLCVLGGLFSEGIDLYGDKLIGAFIVGPGLPQLNSYLNITEEYYEEHLENGKGFAYIYPGFNKVLQAAGRVIRSETDKGIVVLIDDRYSSEEYTKLFPQHWNNVKHIYEEETLKKEIKKFWNNQKNV